MDQRDCTKFLGNPQIASNCPQLPQNWPPIAMLAQSFAISMIGVGLQIQGNPITTLFQPVHGSPQSTQNWPSFSIHPRSRHNQPQNLRTPIPIAINTIKLDCTKVAKLQNIAILLKGLHQDCMTSRTNDAIQVQFFTSLELSSLIHIHIKDCMFLPVIATCLHCTASNYKSINRISITDPCAIPLQSVRKN